MDRNDPGDVTVMHSSALYHGITTWSAKNELDEDGISPGRTSFVFTSHASVIEDCKCRMPQAAGQTAGGQVARYNLARYRHSEDRIWAELKGETKLPNWQERSRNVDTLAFPESSTAIKESADPFGETKTRVASDLKYARKISKRLADKHFQSIGVQSVKEITAEATRLANRGNGMLKINGVSIELSDSDSEYAGSGDEGWDDEDD